MGCNAGRVGNQQLSIHIKRLLDYLKSSEFLARESSGSNSSPEKSLQKNCSIFGLKNRSCDRRYTNTISDVELSIVTTVTGTILVSMIWVPRIQLLQVMSEYECQKDVITNIQKNSLKFAMIR